MAQVSFGSGSLHNSAGDAYCSTTDSNGLLDIHEGTEVVARHGDWSAITEAATGRPAHQSAIAAARSDGPACPSLTAAHAAPAST